jgi:Trk K+ transport system NAD-binding subunit
MLEEIPVLNAKFAGRKVKEIAFHKDAILIMAKSDTNFFIPHVNTYLSQGDILYVNLILIAFSL